MEITVDVESDWGGRATTNQGVEEAIPYLLKLFHSHGITATFFISTQHMDATKTRLAEIKYAGHRLGSHGHTHRSWKGARWWEWRLDYMKSMDVLKKEFGLKRKDIPYRAPKFSWRTDDRYSDPKGHVSLLKHVNLGIPVKKDSILYLHPFDLVSPNTPPPSLFCRLWYSSSSAACNSLEELCSGGGVRE
jgi:hypothetical protein